jgi:hypothetical protein
MDQQQLEAIIKSAVAQALAAAQTPVVETLPFDTKPEQPKPTNHKKHVDAETAELVLILSHTKTDEEIGLMVDRTPHSVRCIRWDARRTLKAKFDK